MDRRTYLAIISTASVGIAGCSQLNSNSGPPENTETQTATDTTTTETLTPTDTETPTPTETAVNIPDDPVAAVEMYLQKYYEEGDREWVNEFRADNGNREPATEEDIEALQEVDVTVNSVELVEENQDSAVVTTSLELEYDDESATGTFRLELRRIEGEWRLWDSRESDDGVVVSNIDFQQSDFGIQSIVRIENNTEQRVTLDVRVEAYEGDLLLDSGSATGEVPAGRILEVEDIYLEVDEARVTEYDVLARQIGASEYTRVSGGSGKTFREKLNS
ncbi:hypothetical protein [Haloarcula sp. H-GB5]